MLVEHRQIRKIFKVKAVLAFNGANPILSRTIDMTPTGMSVTVDDPLPVGLNGRITVDLLVEGKPSPMSTAIKVTACVFGGGAFKISLQFTGLDPVASATLSKFLR